MMTTNRTATLQQSVCDLLYNYLPHAFQAKYGLLELWALFIHNVNIVEEIKLLF